MTEEELYPEPQGPPIVVVVADPITRTRIERAAREMRAVLLPCPDVASCLAFPAPPRAIVVDVTLPGALDAVGVWKADHPDVPVVAVVRIPDPELWSSAESAGADLVVTHGAVHRRLAAFLAGYLAGSGRRRVRVAPVQDFQGRLGFVGHVAPAAEGGDSIALYHVGHSIYAVSDICPHAGAALSQGELDGAVVTCPRHGSQFDVTSGARLRGPSDTPIQTYAVVQEGGFVYVDIPEGAA